MKMISSEKENKQATIKNYLIEHPDASLRELGELLGVSRQRVHVLLKGMDLKIKRLHRWQNLTEHQLDILRHVAGGYTDKQIAGFIGCRAQSIRNQLQVIYSKLNVHNRKGAVEVAKQQRLFKSKKSV
jgi:DNA-binding CsgD family transcriptional regulator